MKKFLFIFTILACFNSSNLLAQAQLKHVARMYRGTDDRLYIQKDLPIYIRVATSPDPKAPTMLLKSERQKRYSNPMYFDVEGFNSLRTPTAVDTVTRKVIEPKQDIYFDMYADGKPASSAFSFANTNKYTNNNKTFYQGTSSLSFTSKDALSGVEGIYFSIDKKEYELFKSPMNFTEEKEYFLQYYSADNVGNVEKVQNHSFWIDKTPPITDFKIVGEQSGTVFSAKTIVEIPSQDATSGLNNTKYFIDKQSNQVYRNSVSMMDLTEGEHEIGYFSTDNVGNEETKKAYQFYLDRTGPMVINEILGDKFYTNGKNFSSGRTKLQITAVDNKAGIREIYYTLNNGEKLKYEKPFYLPNQQGSIVVKSYAVDNVGNISLTSEENGKTILATFVDLTGPSLSHLFVGNTFTVRDTVYINKSTKLKLMAKDNESGVNHITYSPDKLDEIEYKEPFIIADEKLHLMEIIGYDNVGNTNSKKIMFVSDYSGPEIIPQFGVPSKSKKMVGTKSLDVYPSHLVFFLSGIDKLVGFDKMYYTLNNQPEKLYADLIKGFQKGQDYKIKVRALDKLGNESTMTLEFAIE